MSKALAGDQRLLPNRLLREPEIHVDPEVIPLPPTEVHQVVEIQEHHLCPVAVAIKTQEMLKDVLLTPLMEEVQAIAETLVIKETISDMTIVAKMETAESAMKIGELMEVDMIRIVEVTTEAGVIKEANTPDPDAPINIMTTDIQTEVGMMKEEKEEAQIMEEIEAMVTGQVDGAPGLIRISILETNMGDLLMIV